MLFPQLFEQSVARTPDRTAVVNLATGTELSYAELQDRAYAVAQGLSERGVQPGDRVAICMANRPEHVVTFVATQLMGAVATPFNFRLPADDVRYHLEDSTPEAFIFDQLSREAVEKTSDSIDSGIDIVYVGDDETPDFAESFDDLLDTSAQEPSWSADYDDPSVMLYSSGTTGDPKGIPLTHEATTSRHLTNSLGQHYYLNETMIGIMPLYHTVGVHGILCGLLGMSGTYLSVPQFDPERCVEAIEEWGVTALHEAPTIFQQLLGTDAIEETDVSTVSKVGYSGAPMSQALYEEALEVFEPDHIANLYGTTEVYGTLAYVDLHDIGDPAVTGPANVFLRTRIVELDEDDPEAEVEPGVEGELIVHTDSPIAFEGYWNKPGKTEKAITDGWFFTGDVAKRTEEGNTIITGRVDDMIVSGGENIYPAEVEDVLAGHDAVEEAAVIGVPNEEWGEIVKAYIVASDDVSAEELEQFCLESDSLADFKRPREYQFVKTLPRNPSGKVMRYKLRGDEA